MVDRSVLVIGLDALERSVADRLIGAGRLPTLARLTEAGLVADMINPSGMLTGPVWPTIATGTGPDRHRIWTWRPLRTGTYRKRYAGMFVDSGHPPVWVELANRGHSVLSLDVPRIRPIDDETMRRSGRQITGLHVHDLRDTSGPLTVPAPLREQVLETSRPYFDRCDALRAEDRLDDIFQEFERTVEEKVTVLDRLFDDDRPDLAFVVFPECHCAGHQFFQRHDAAWRDPSAGTDLLAATYELLDDALGRVIDRHATAATDVIVVMSHGMGDVRPVSRVLPAFLERLDDVMGAAPLHARARAFVERVPNRTARLVRRIAGRDIESLDHWVDGSKRFFRLSVFDSHGSVRLNLEGREPRGRVRREDYASTLDRLERELRALRDIETGEPVVVDVESRAARGPADVDAGFGDLSFEWAMSERVVRGVRSESLGEIMIEPERFRPGNHLRDGRAIFVGPSFDAGRRAPIRAEDIAPTIAACLGHELPSVDGSAIVDPRREPLTSSS